MMESAQGPQTDRASVIALEMFTDEELAILVGTPGIVVSPFLDRVAAEQRPAVDRTAFRSLIARGVIDPPGFEALSEAGTPPDDGLVELLVREDVRAMVALRVSATAVIAIARTTSVQQDFWYAHVVEDACLLEQVGADGIHRFALLDVESLPEAVAAAVIHPEAGDASGESVPLDASPEAAPPPRIADALGSALVRADLAIKVVDEPRPTLTGVFNGPQGTWSFRCAYGSNEPVVAEPRTVVELRNEIHAEVVKMLSRVRGDSRTSAV